MENEFIYRIISGILFIIILVTRKIYESQAETVAKDGLVQDRDNKRMIGLQSLLLTVSLIALIAYIINPRWVSWSTIRMAAWLRWLGAATGILGAGLLVWSHLVLGKNFFGGLKIRKEHKLIKEGPYRWLRHPIYTAFVGIGVGFFLMTGNWLIGGTWLGSSLLVIATRMNAEEEMMLEQFGDEYRAYQNQTAKLLPRFRGRRVEKDPQKQGDETAQD